MLEKLHFILQFISYKSITLLMSLSYIFMVFLTIMYNIHLPFIDEQSGAYVYKGEVCVF